MPHTDDIHGMMVKFDERQKTIFNMLSRIDKHLEKLNGKVAEHESRLVELKTVGGVALIALPIIVNVVMRLV
jgi:hypothetical protein|tara:strand:- start:307 stop:522 length:216 start_codon:yes stop_codon:yes gene_type:complete